LKRTLTATLVVASLLTGADLAFSPTTAAGPHIARAAAVSSNPLIVPAGCFEVFTAQQTVNYAARIFSGTRTVTTPQRQHLHWMEYCQRYVGARAWVQHYDALLAQRHHRRVEAPSIWVLASWYTDGTGTACGFDAYYGVANKDLPCGTHVTFRNGNATVTAIVDDRGPYVGDRVYDLNQNVMSALGFMCGVCEIRASNAGV
jgi:rare lipoprotein A (peptidoglycan hydrolase)